MKLKFEGEKELREKLKLQSQAFADHLADALRIREEELTRILGRDFDEKLTEERCKFKAQVGAMVGRLKGMDDAFKGKLYRKTAELCNFYETSNLAQFFLQKILRFTLFMLRLFKN